MSVPLTTAAPCEAHTSHTPRSHVNQRHHILPLEFGGQTVPDNLVTVCPTGHINVHSLLDAYRKAGGDPGWQVRRRYAPRERELALLGWQRIQRQSM